MEWVGLIMMTMVQNAFANTSSSMVISKVQGNIVDVLMPPLSATELFIGYITGGVLRGLMVGLAAGIGCQLDRRFFCHPDCRTGDALARRCRRGSQPAEAAPRPSRPGGLSRAPEHQGG